MSGRTVHRPRGLFMRVRLPAILTVALALAPILALIPGAPALAQFGPGGPPAVGVVTVQKRPVTESSEFVGRFQATD